MTGTQTKLLMGLFLGLAVAVHVAVVAQTPTAKKAADGMRTHYRIQLELDFDSHTYTGNEVLRWFNRGDRPVSVLYFHLYPNLRVDQSPTSVVSQPAAAPDEPSLEIASVRTVEKDLPLNFSLDEQGTILRVNLREAVSAGNFFDLAIKFKGMVPVIDPEETGLATHVVKQLSAAIRGEREVRRARELNFHCRGMMFLGTFFPVLAVRDGDDWARRLEPTVGDFVFNEVADYDVTIHTGPGISLFTSGVERSTSQSGPRSFHGTNLREFALVAGQGLRFEETQVGHITLRSVFLPEHERVGKRVLSLAADALRIFNRSFSDLPYQTLTITEAPLVAGLGSAEFSGLNVIASAFYVDFDAPAMRNLPEIIREQRPAVEQSLEWTVAYLIAHQWWGAVVGNNPAREPVLDEGLSSWSALLYYKDKYGAEQAATVRQDQLIGVYRLYRTFGGEDMDANRPARDYRNSFQYEAIVTTKGALMFAELQRLLGEQRFLDGLRGYLQANRFEIADLDDLRGALIAETPLEQRRIVARTFNRWLSSKRGDEDIAQPDTELAASLGLPPKPPQPKGGGDRNAFGPFAKLGKFFWQQMTRIR